MPTPSKTSKKDTEIFKKLDALDAQDPNIIPAWLIEIKKDPTAANVSNPLTDKEISTTAPSGVYNSIIKWCMEKYQGYDFRGIPNAQNFATPAAAAAATATAATAVAAVAAVAATAAVAKATSPDFDVILTAKNWKEKPKIDPFTGETIKISLNHESDYVFVYKKIMNKLVKHILKNTSRHGDVLTVDECKYIQSSLPNVHALSSWYKIYYDYLFIEYFIQSKTIKYNVDFLNNTDIYIYNVIYNTQKSVNVKDTVDDLLMTFAFDIKNTKFSIINLVMGICSDIKKILYMHESKITAEAINEVTLHKMILEYCRQLFELYYQNINNDLRNEIAVHFNTLQRLDTDRKNKKHYIYQIYNQINIYAGKDRNIYGTLISICDSILKLYSDNNIKDTVYKYIEDPYNVDLNLEPQMPRKPQLSTKLQLYKLRLNNLKNAVKDAEKDMDKVLKLNKAKKDLKDFEEKVEEIDGKEIKINVLNKENLKVYDEQIEEWKDKLKVYEKYEMGKKIKRWNEDINEYDKDMLIKIKKKNVKKNVLVLPVRNRKFKSEDNIRPPSVSLVKYSSKLKAFTSVKQRKESAIDYVNATDPYTQEEFKDMHPTKQKYVSHILVKDGDKEFHYRFDTVNIYNYILKCKETCIKPKNFYSKSELTNENFDEICDKIKFFTKSPTYSSFDIRQLFNNCIYDNCLILDYEIRDRYDYSKEIIGDVHVYLNIRLGGILFRVINKIDPVSPGTIVNYDNYPNLSNPSNSYLITLPLFNKFINGYNINDVYDPLIHTYPEDLIYFLNTILSDGGLIDKTYFPYRKNNNDGQIWKTVLDLPKFQFNNNDTVKDALDKLKTYKEEIQNR